MLREFKKIYSRPVMNMKFVKMGIPFIIPDDMRWKWRKKLYIMFHLYFPWKI